MPTRESAATSVSVLAEVGSAGGGGLDVAGSRLEGVWPPALVLGLLVALALLTWPRRVRPQDALLAEFETVGHGSPAVLEGSDVSVWQQDPLLLYRRWRLRRDREHLLDGVLVLLDSMAPALAMGLPPVRALALAAEATSGAGVDAGTAPGRRRGDSELERLTRSLTAAAGRGGALASVWSDWARLTRAPEISFVASAWALSERHGAPLAVAVERAAAGLREARARQRKVRVAVAGPRATVTVLTVLPLTGPAFGIACGIDPARLYAGSRIGAISAVLGVALIVVGRLWCRRMIRKAVAS
ncbi:type II secretion system F family protein [Humibacillus xanthopallidus]|uniref:Tight adherence protein B n=1 Tax=Humibacillus xanthopallidus TaxID=412689 RepID=A0A543I1P3_9MICO|nr:type II secretion system F family protein [Humibacillus xanthopallidus]TQM64514.1 tight adherence protein B [Humibacillus xanthopallidus]